MPGAFSTVVPPSRCLHIGIPASCGSNILRELAVFSFLFRFFDEAISSRQFQLIHLSHLLSHL